MKLHPPSPFTITQSKKSWYSFYHSTEDRRLSWPRWLVTYPDGLPACKPVTHPSTNWAQCQLTTLIELNVLTTALRHTTRFLAGKLYFRYRIGLYARIYALFIIFLPSSSVLSLAMYVFNYVVYLTVLHTTMHFLYVWCSFWRKSSVRIKLSLEAFECSVKMFNGKYCINCSIQGIECTDCIDTRLRWMYR